MHIVTDLSPLTTHYSLKKAFTLAEVLITLTVIGVVAAITLPTVVNNIRDRQFRALWKKTFSEVSQAYTNAFAENPITIKSTARDIGFGTAEQSKEIYYQVFSRMTNDFCVKDTGDEHDCATYQWTIKPKNKQSPVCSSLSRDIVEGWCMYSSRGGYGRLKNGVLIYALGYLWAHPMFTVDVNGLNPPNTVGRDIFVIFFRDNKVIPGGAPGVFEAKGCDKSIESKVNSATYAISGSGCGYKYLYE